ncbi:hypothetical protein MK805_17170 [Shimazuella sp. AN120528]|uniref:hypothetical protein n=1 Tax=Shimazuella soli TaxID=1892854 RepID=UPI001F1151E9|nr:hypothetical protein [Shimazuella soli]MCH5586669.1 hypothetical protein [Shimazuella soli]
MDLRIKLDGFSIDRCSQDAVVTSGTNSITQRNLQKQNQGIAFIGSGQLHIEEEEKYMMDIDTLDHCVWSGDNWAMKST